jgi:hypothetical protein
MKSRSEVYIYVLRSDLDEKRRLDKISFLNRDDIGEARKRRRRHTFTYAEEPMTKTTKRALD